MIVLAMCRIGCCELCLSQFYLEAEEVPEKCPACGSRLWLYGVEPRYGRLIRQGIAHADKVVNKGVTSAKLQAWSKAQVAKRPPMNARKVSLKVAASGKRRKANLANGGGDKQESTGVGDQQVGSKANS